MKVCTVNIKDYKSVDNNYIPNQEGFQIMCEIIENFRVHGITEYYKIILDNYTYDCYEGLKQEQFNVTEWNSRIVNYGFNILISSEVWYMFKYDNEWFRKVFEDVGYISRFIRCKELLLRIFRRYNLEWKSYDSGRLMIFRKVVKG
jgi:hypothetical protein